MSKRQLFHVCDWVHSDEQHPVLRQMVNFLKSMTLTYGAAQLNVTSNQILVRANQASFEAPTSSLLMCDIAVRTYR